MQYYAEHTSISYSSYIFWPGLAIIREGTYYANINYFSITFDLFNSCCQHYTNCKVFTEVKYHYHI